MQKIFLVTASINGLLATVFGAFGAHILKTKLSPVLLSAYQTGVQYQFYHSLALLLVGIVLFHVQNKWLDLSACLFILGIILFSGSLYLLSITGAKWIGIITPLGGISFILGWLFLMLGILKIKA